MYIEIESPPINGPPPLMSNQVLLDKLSQTHQLLSVKLAELVRSSGLEEDEGTENELRTAAAGTIMVHSQTQQLVKGVQDLLVLTRSIREKWLLTQLPAGRDAASPQDNAVDGLAALLETCMDEMIADTP